MSLCLTHWGISALTDVGPRFIGKKRCGSGHFILTTMPKGSAQTLIGPIKIITNLVATALLYTGEPPAQRRSDQFPLLGSLGGKIM